MRVSIQDFKANWIPLPRKDGLDDLLYFKTLSKPDLTVSKPPTHKTYMYISTPEVKEIALKLFPQYNGKRFEVRPFQGPMRLDSYWSGGSRDLWGIINLGTGKQGFVPENGTPFTAEVGQLETLPFNCVLGNYHQGGYNHITLYVHPDNLKAFQVEAPDETTDDEKIVLVATRTTKSTYAGISNYRFKTANEDTGITLERWDAAKASCISKGLLNRAGAITDAGRNIASFEKYGNLHVLMSKLQTVNA